MERWKKQFRSSCNRAFESSSAIKFEGKGKQKQE
jgi:hypothetical protein